MGDDFSGDRALNAAQIPPPLRFTPALSGRIGVSLAAVAISALTIAMFTLIAPALRESLPLAIVLGAVGFVMASLSALVAKEAVARWRLRAGIYAGRLTASLPRRRGFIAFDREGLDTPLADIARIDTRLEHFESLGVSTSQRAYRLALRDGRGIELGGDREMMPAFFGPLVEAIVARTGAPVVDHGVVDGDAGFMLVAGQSAPPWDTPALSASEAALRARKRARTAPLLIFATLLTILTQLISRS